MRLFTFSVLCPARPSLEMMPRDELRAMKSNKFHPKHDQPLLSTHLPTGANCCLSSKKEQRFHTLILYFLTYTVKNKETQSLFSSCKAHIAFTPFFLPKQNCLFLLLCLLGMILGRWHPLKPLSRKAPAQGDITPRGYRMVNQGWKLFLGLFGGIILQDGAPELVQGCTDMD